MVYHWDDKETECYRLYVEEKKSLDEVIAYWEARGFTPSKRAFQTQFKRWDFPSKQNPAHKNPAIIARLQQLWEQNYTQKEMVDILQNEGHQINDRELIRLRLRLKLLLRESVPRPRKNQIGGGGVQKKVKRKKPKVFPGKGLINQLGNAILAESTESDESSGDEDGVTHASAEAAATPAAAAGGEPLGDVQPAEPESTHTSLDPEETLRRQLRQEQLQRESDEKWRTRKRRRRTRGWAGLPADTPGEPPRFPSETTIDEAKAYLGLDNGMYRRLRERFQELCEAEGVVKKTVAGPEKWAHLVQRLIQEDAHLVSVFQEEPEVLQINDALFRPKGQRALSIDVICMDVTKRLRTMETRMTLADAKNTLGLNPEQTRQVRAAYIAKLKTAHFTNKHEAGEEQWAQLKTAWISESEDLSRALAQGESDPGYARKLRAVEVLARDVMKRQQQEKLAKDPSKKKQIHQGPGPGPAPPVVAPQPERRRQSAGPDYSASTQIHHAAPLALSPSNDLQIDPSLLLAASDAAVLPGSTYHQPEHQYQSQHDQTQGTQPPISVPHQSSAHHYSQNYYPAATSQHSQPMPIYFRLHHLSATPFPSKTVWLSILHTQSVSEISNLVMREHPGTVVLKVEGLVTVATFTMEDDQAKQNPATDQNGYPARPIPKNDDKCEYFNKTQLLQLLERLSPWALRIFLQTWHPFTFGFFLCSVVGSDLQVSAMRIGDVWETDETGDHVEPLVIVDKGAYYGEAPDLVPYTDKGEPRRAKVDADGFWASGVLESYNRSNGAERTNARLSHPGIVALIQFMMLLGNKRLLYYYEKPSPSDLEERHMSSLVHALHVVTYNHRANAVVKSTPRPPLPSSISANTQARSVLPAQQTPAQQSAQQQQTLPPSQTTQYRQRLPSTAQYPAAMNPQISSQSGFYYSTMFHQEELQYPQGNPYPHAPIHPYTQAPAQSYFLVPSYPYPQAQSSRKGKEPTNPHSQALMNPYAQTNPFPQALLDPRLMDGSSGLTRPDVSSSNVFDHNSASANSNSNGFFGSNSFASYSNNFTPYSAAGAHGYESGFSGSSGFTSINPPHQNGSFVTVPDAGSQSSRNAFGFGAVDGSVPMADQGMDTALGLPPALTDASTLGTNSVGSVSIADNGSPPELGPGEEMMEGAKEEMGMQTGRGSEGVGEEDEVQGGGASAAKRRRVG
ncbi:hypothetical protein E8E13_009213 [Curvularia kusanoi]|uniref:Clr5 domain-containing protein n=1 Tax=Curvularia kusanoi TaxID=90978 RepID=A0A9P4TE64_CURKU|nr:hypothetical protein E8E13_009213 [Curvularia kusanoi]